MTPKEKQAVLDIVSECLHPDYHVPFDQAMSMIEERLSEFVEDEKRKAEIEKECWEIFNTLHPEFVEDEIAYCPNCGVGAILQRESENQIAKQNLEKYLGAPVLNRLGKKSLTDYLLWLEGRDK